MDQHRTTSTILLDQSCWTHRHMKLMEIGSTHRSRMDMMLSVGGLNGPWRRISCQSYDQLIVFVVRQMRTSRAHRWCGCADFPLRKLISYWTPPNQKSIWCVTCLEKAAKRPKEAHARPFGATTAILLLLLVPTTSTIYNGHEQQPKLFTTPPQPAGETCSQCLRWRQRGQWWNIFSVPMCYCVTKILWKHRFGIKY